MYRTATTGQRARSANRSNHRRLAESAAAAGPDVAVPTAPKRRVTDAERGGCSRLRRGRPADVDPGIAAVLISNHLTMLTSPTWKMQRPESAHAIRGTGQTLQWRATDTAAEARFVERRPDGATWQPGTRHAEVTVTGLAAADLDPPAPTAKPSTSAPVKVT